jgi:hypothetical protein
MGVPASVRQREYNKFVPDSNGDTAVNTVISGGSVGFTPSGLDIGLRITTLTVGDTATALPATAFSNRESISIQNKGTVTVYLGNSDVTADTVVGTTSGYELLPGGFFNIDITPDIVLYGRCASGQSAIIKILEIA